MYTAFAMQQRLTVTHLQYITWIQNGTAAWTLLAAGMGPDQRVEIDARPIPEEPLVRFLPIMCLLVRS